MEKIADAQPLVSHLIELRKRLIWVLMVFVVGFFICYYFSNSLFDFLVQPLSDILHQKGGERRLIYTSLTEAFTTYIKISFFFAFIMTFPFLCYHVWQFVVPALFKNERFIFRCFLVSIPLFFLIGAFFAYYIIFPTAYTFFLSFETTALTSTSLPIQLEAKLNEYLSFVMRLILAFGICFELPVILSLLSFAKILSYESLKKHWRIAIVAIFALSAFITPPDVLSMLGLAIPLIALYGVSLIMVQLIESRYCVKEIVG
ncbi:MAG: twin-arginine translocase subunit TatC [Proteobacteria bacterium]|nr:twin-arginine translocase subunit TatC [Pseudomonadota bacterium]